MKYFVNFYCIILYSITYLGICDAMKLELVQVIFRHGARAPSKEEARIVNVTDPTMYGPHGFYELTNEGKAQSYRLGSLLRREYNEFLNGYNPRKFYAYSSAYTRTKMTMQLVLAGLYSVSDKEIWNTELNWQPIAFEQAFDKCDALLTPHQCKKYIEMYEKVIFQSEEFKKQVSKYDYMFDFLSKVTGINYKDNILYYCGWTYYVINIHKMMNLSLPSWCTEDIYESMKEMFILTMSSMSMTPELIRINGGTLVRKTLENIESNNNNYIPRKIYLYSTHDLTIAGFTNAQKVKAFDIPPFGSAVIMETFKDDYGQQYLRMRSWDGLSENFKTVEIMENKEYCLLEDYKQMVKNTIPTDEELDLLTK